MSPSPSATSTPFNRDESDPAALESMLARLTEMVCRRLREHQLHARKVQLKLRYSDFTTYTRGHTLERATQLDAEVLEIVRELFRANWEKGRAVRLLGVQTNALEAGSGQMELLASAQETRLKQAMNAVDALARPLRRVGGFAGERNECAIPRAYP